MANNTYGIKKPAVITANDVDIYYHYRPSRNSDDPNFSGFQTLDRTLLSQFTVNGETGSLPGMYNLKLPLGKFGKSGIYTVYIKPREIKTTIVDVSTLAAYPDIKGIVINSSDLQDDAEAISNGGLVGYRVEYFDSNNERSTDYRIITSSNKCEPVTSTLTSTIQKGVTYMYNNSGNLLFCTVTPSTSLPFNSSSLPFIGQAGQSIALINTKFNPVMLEIEMTEHDIETVSTMLEGDQLRNLDYALITTFNKDGGIYNQSSYGHVVNKAQSINADFRIKNDDAIVFEEAQKLKNIKENI